VAHFPRIQGKGKREAIMILKLSIRVLHQMRIQQFTVRADPASLEISRHPSGVGYEISITDSDQAKRIWFAVEIHSLEFIKDGFGNGDNDGAAVRIPVRVPEQNTGWRA
jgi:hypothetical protein